LKKKKIIHFLPASKKAKGRSSDSNKIPMNTYMASWAGLQAKNTLKYTDKYDLELWVTDRKTETFESEKIKNIEYKLFPLKKKRKNIRLSFSMLKELRKETQHYDVLINLHAISTIETTVLVFLFRKCPVVVHHHGDIPLEFRKKSGFIKQIIRTFFSTINKQVLKRVDYFSVISAYEKDYLLGFIESYKIQLEQGRKHFNDWKPIEKIKARNKLGINPNKKVIIYIGYYYKLKGVDILLNAFKELKNKYDMELILIGGKPSDPLYNNVKESGAKEFGKVPNNELIYYYSASDVYVFYSENENLVKFGGLGTAPIEALACNVPVVSSQLIHFPTDEWKKVGEIPETREDVIPCIEKILNNPEHYSPRKISRKYYDFESIIKNNIKIYDQLFNRYYGVQ
jgi:glycosyltransferase involved in cell wall biosynthesis